MSNLCKYLNQNNWRCFLQLTCATRKLKGISYHNKSREAWHGRCPNYNPVLEQLKDCFLYTSATRYFKCETCIFYYAVVCLKHKVPFPKTVCSFYVSSDLVHYFNPKLKNYLGQILDIYTVNELQQIWLKFKDAEYNHQIDLTTEVKVKVETKTVEKNCKDEPIPTDQELLIRKLMHLLIDQALSFTSNHNGITDTLKIILKTVCKKYNPNLKTIQHNAVKTYSNFQKVIKSQNPKHLVVNGDIILVLTPIKDYNIYNCHTFESAIVRVSEIITKLDDKELAELYKKYIYKLGVE